MDEGGLLPPIPYAMHTKFKSLHFHGMFLPKNTKVVEILCCLKKIL